jgi:hypothetical protein
MFKNRVRLPFKITRPQFPEEKSTFRKADGSSKTVSSVIRKTYEGETDNWPEKWHERFTIALSHDDVAIEGEKYIGEVSKDGDYNIDWADFLDYPVAKAKFSVEVTPFNATNSNCQSCEEVTQVSLQDDFFPDELGEDQPYSLNLVENDSVCCYPSTITIVNYNTDIILTAAIDAQGVLSITTKPELTDAVDALLLTYRITCPNGGYDEGNVYGTVNGSISSCVAPTNIRVGEIIEGEATLLWDAAPAAVSYDWELISSENPGIPEQTGNTLTPTVSITGLNEDNPVTYTLYVKTNCGDDDGSSEFGIPLSFNNLYNSPSCGSYKFTYIGSPENYGIAKSLSYTSCIGGSETGFPVNTTIFHYAYDCLLESAPGVPVYWAGTDIIIEYLGVCLPPVTLVNRMRTPGLTVNCKVGVRINGAAPTRQFDGPAPADINSNSYSPITSVNLYNNGTVDDWGWEIRPRAGGALISSGVFSGTNPIIPMNETAAIDILIYTTT